MLNLRPTAAKGDLPKMHQVRRRWSADSPLSAPTWRSGAVPEFLSEKKRTFASVLPDMPPAITGRGRTIATNASTDARYSVPAFADQLFEHLPRTDQRKWARAYLEALMTTRGKKTVRRLAASVSDSPTASQSLHQFVNASPWDWMPVRQEIARWAETRLTPQAWLLDFAVIRKRGEHSCGVHRRFDPATGRSATCQVGVGAFLANADAAVPVDWRLLLPGSWANDPQ